MSGKWAVQNGLLLGEGSLISVVGSGDPEMIARPDLGKRCALWHVGYDRPVSVRGRYVRGRAFDNP